MGENILQVIVDYEKVYGMTSVVDGVGIWINNVIWVVEALVWKQFDRKSYSKDSRIQNCPVLPLAEPEKHVRFDPNLDLNLNVFQVYINSPIMELVTSYNFFQKFH